MCDNKRYEFEKTNVRLFRLSMGALLIVIERIFWGIWQILYINTFNDNRESVYCLFTNDFLNDILILYYINPKHYIPKGLILYYQNTKNKSKTNQKTEIFPFHKNHYQTLGNTQSGNSDSSIVTNS